MNSLDYKRPNPDELLASLLKEDEKNKRGKLKIFFGMCAGVGKTYTMLQTAHAEKLKGNDIIIGYVETHDRKETDELVEGFELIPRKSYNYKTISIKDMDLDAIYTDEIRKKMEAEALSSGRKQVWEDRFQWPLAGALLCLVAELVLPVTRKTIAASLLAALTLLSPTMAHATDTRDGISAYEKGDFEQALKHFTDAQLNAPDRAEMLYNVADAYYKTGNFDAAAEHYKQVLETDDPELKRKALFNLGNAEFRRGKARDAIGHYEAALSIAPDDRQTMENLEFVKKALEQQKQQQSDADQKDGDKNDQGRKNESEPKDGQQSPSSGDPNQPEDGSRENQPDGQQEQQRPEFRDQMDEQQSQQASRDNDAQNDEKPSSEPQSAQSGEPTGDPQQAERMLNRLQDQPGRALMPATGEQHVEKDW